MNRHLLLFRFLLTFLLLSVTTAMSTSEPPVILCFGDSLTAGFGVEAGESYPARLEVRLRERGYPHRVVNAGVSGDTTAGGVRRLDWALRSKPAIVILELGINDGMRGIPPVEIRRNLATMLSSLQQRGVKVILAGMRLPPNYGLENTAEFAAVYSALAREYPVALIPFFLEGVAGHPQLNLADGAHPNPRGYQVVLETVWDHLLPLLGRPAP